MKTKDVVLLAAVSLFCCSCAPMPGNTLMQGVSRESLPEEVEIIETVDFFETQQYCNQNAPIHQLVLNCVTNACFIPACAVPFVDKEGVVRKCYIYMWTENGYLREHETRHCYGFKDVLY